MISEKGDYARVYDDMYWAIIKGKDKKVQDHETIMVMYLLEQGIKGRE